VRVTVLALNATLMHVDLSFSYLRSAEAASFDKKSSTGTAHLFGSFGVPILRFELRPTLRQADYNLPTVYSFLAMPLSQQS
jgi:hypothetical protein